MERPNQGKLKWVFITFHLTTLKTFHFFSARMAIIMYTARSVLRRAAYVIGNCQRGQEVFKEPFTRCLILSLKELASNGTSQFPMTLPLS